MLDSKGFDLWADGYDESVNLSEESNEYPFAGYKEVLNSIYCQAREKENPNILDIGFGTGILTTQLYKAGCNITGIDFSKKMVDIAQLKMPNAKLIHWDFTKGLPEEIKLDRFDFIISTYAIHHLTDIQKINFIESLALMLKENGKILIGDVSFNTRNEFNESREKYHHIWDDDEFYFVSEEIKKDLNSEYLCGYEKISYCAGILSIKNK